MKILVLSTIDNRGGAALVAWEIRKKLKLLGHSVNTFVRYKYSNEKDVFQIPRRRYQDWLVKLFANDLRFARTSYIFGTKEYREADIIHCHNLHSNFFNLRDLARMSREKKVIWTMHDLWAITGFASDSVTRAHPNKKRFLLYLWDNTAHLLRIKKRIYNRCRLTIVAVSDWMKKELEKSVLSKQKILRIYNGVQPEIFRPYDKAAVRAKLGLPISKKIISFGLKGWLASEKVLKLYENDENIFFVSIGHSNIKAPANRLKSFSYTTNKNLMAEYYSASDVFLYPTQGDSFGLVAAEALSCGTPVVATDIDALPEIVENGRVGIISPSEKPEDLKRSIDQIFALSGAEYEDMRIRARKRIVEKFSLERMTEEYIDLYRDVLK